MVKLFKILSLTAVIFFFYSPAEAKLEFSLEAPPLAYVNAKEREWKCDVSIFCKQSDGNHSTTALRPFLFYRETKEKEGYSYFSFVWPIVRYERENREYKKWVLPVFFDFGKDRGKPTEKRTKVILPFYFERLDKIKDYRKVFVPFVFGYTEDKTFSEKTYLTPFFRFASDPSKDLVRNYYPWPIFSYKKKGPSISHNYFPFFSSRSNSESGRSSGSALVLANWKKSPEGASKSLIPLWHTSRYGENRRGFLLPFYYYDIEGREKSRYFFTPLAMFYKDLDKRRGYVLPYFWGSDSSGASYSYLPPLWFSSYGSDGYGYSTLLPIYYNRGFPEGYTKFLTPFAMFKKYNESRDNYILPYFWGSDGLGGKYSVLPPIWYSSFDKDGYGTSTLVPIYYSNTHPEGYTRFVTPFSMFKKDGAGRDNYVFPYFWGSDGEGGKYSVLPPVWYSSFDKEGYGTSTLLPIYYNNTHTEGYTRFITPLSMFKKDGKKRDNYVLPYFWGSDGEGGKYSVLPPIWYSSFDKDGYGTRTLVPLYYNNIHKEGYTKFVTPLAYFSKNGDKKRNYVLPYFWGSDSDGEGYGVAFPLWYHFYNKTSDTKTFLPLFYKSSNSESGEDVLFIAPSIYSRKTPTKSSFVVAPVYFSFEDKEAGSKSRYGLPLWFYSKDQEFKFNVILPFYYNFKNYTTDTETKYFFPFYGNYRRGDVAFSNYFMFPLYAEKEDKEVGLKAYDVMWPLFHYDKHNTGGKVWALPPVFLKIEDEKYNLTTALLSYFSYENKKKRSSTKIATPLLSASHVRKDDSGEEIFSKKFVLGPLFVSTKDKEAKLSRWSFLFPISMFEDRVVEGESRERDWVLPLYYKQRDGEKKQVYLFPLVARRTTIGDRYSDWFLLGPLAMGTRDDELELKKWSFLFTLAMDETRGDDYRESRFIPFYRYKRSGDTTSFNSLFLFGYDKRGESYRKWYGFGPLFVGEEDKDIGLSRLDLFFPLSRFKTEVVEGEINKNNWILPFYYHKQDGDSKKTYIPPLLSGWSSVGDKSSEWFFMGPLLSGARDKETDLKRLSFLASLAMHETKGDSYTKSRVLPFYWYKRDGDYSYFNSLLLYDFEKRGDYFHKWHLLGPMFTSIRDDRIELKSKSFLFSLVMHETKGDSYTKSRVLPFYWYKRDGDHSYFNGLLLYDSEKRGDYFHKWHIAGPMFTSIRDDREELRSKSYLFSLALFEKKKDTIKRRVAPIFFQGSDSNSSYTYVVPVFGTSRRGDESTTFLLGPLYVNQKKGTYNKDSILWPFFSYGKDSESRDWDANALLYFGSGRGDVTRHTVFPIWWHKKDSQMTRDCTVVIHCYEKNSASGESSLSLFYIVPKDFTLILHEKSPSKTKKRFYPLYRYVDNKEDSKTDFSFLWITPQREGSGTELAKIIGGLGTVFSYKSEGVGENKSKEYSFLSMIFRYKSGKDFFDFEFNPLFSIEKGTKGPDSSRFVILGGLFGREKRSDGSVKYQILYLKTAD